MGTQPYVWRPVEAVSAHLSDIWRLLEKPSWALSPMSGGQWRPSALIFPTSGGCWRSRRGHLALCLAASGGRQRCPSWRLAAVGEAVVGTQPYVWRPVEAVSDYLADVWRLREAVVSALSIVWRPVEAVGHVFLTTGG